MWRCLDYEALGAYWWKSCETSLQSGLVKAINCSLRWCLKLVTIKLKFVQYNWAAGGRQNAGLPHRRKNKMCRHKTTGIFVPQTKCTVATDASTVGNRQVKKIVTCLLWQLNAPHCAPTPPQWHLQKVPLRRKKKRNRWNDASTHEWQTCHWLQQTSTECYLDWTKFF